MGDPRTAESSRGSRSSRFLLVSSAILLGLGALPAQTPAPKGEPDPVIKVDVDLVSFYCSVRDRRGGFIKNLDKDAFLVFEDGKRQDIRYFTRESDLPLTIGLLVDVSKSQENLIEVERRAAGQFFHHVLRPKDMAFLMSFGSEAELLQDLTGSARLLQKGLEGLRLSVPVGGPLPSPTGAKQRGTILYDAVYLAADEKLKREVGRKVVVLITDGMDFGSRLTIQQAIESAQRADSIIYGIYYVDQRMYGFGGSDSALRRMAEETGGRVFHVGGRNSLEVIFDEIQEEVRSQYAIAYSPANAIRDGGFRKLDVRMVNKDLKVAARKGYYAPRS